MTTPQTDYPRTDSTTRSNIATASSNPMARTIDIVALVLMIIGGLNWGLVGLFDYDLVASLFGPMSALTRIIYVLVGLAALYGIVIAARIASRRV